MPLYSHSRLSCFEQCPLKFKFAYIDKLKTEVEETVETFLGSRVHETLEKLYKDLKFQKILTLKELLDFFNSEWKKNWNDGIVIVRDGYNQENYRKMGEKFITDYYKRYKPFNQTKTIGLETTRTVALDENYRIHIRIDRLALTENNVYEIHDYKTSNSLPTQEDLDKDRQLAVYAYGIKKMYPDAKKIRLVWHFLAFDKEMSSERTDDQLEKLRKEILKLIKEIESCKDFPSKESKLCDWCEFKPICPNFKHLYKLDKKTPNQYLNDDGVKIVNKYADVYKQIKKKEEELEELREALILYAEKNGINVVYGSDVKASVRSYPKLSFPKKYDPRIEQFKELIKTLGLWNKLATVDVYELAKMINNKELHEDFLKLLEPFIERNSIYKVYLRKK